MIGIKDSSFPTIIWEQYVVPPKITFLANKLRHKKIGKRTGHEIRLFVNFWGQSSNKNYANCLAGNPSCSIYCNKVLKDLHTGCSIKNLAFAQLTATHPLYVEKQLILARDPSVQSFLMVDQFCTTKGEVAKYRQFLEKKTIFNMIIIFLWAVQLSRVNTWHEHMTWTCPVFFRSKGTWQCERVKIEGTFLIKREEDRTE